LFLPSLFPFVFPLDLRIPLHVRACRILATPKNSLLAVLDFLFPVGFQISFFQTGVKASIFGADFCLLLFFGHAEHQGLFLFSFGHSPVSFLRLWDSCPWRSVSHLSLLGLRSSLIFHAKVSTAQSHVYAPTLSICVCWFSFAADLLSLPEIFCYPRSTGSSPIPARALGGVYFPAAQS
jgi:hypothetical protein